MGLLLGKAAISESRTLDDLCKLAASKEPENAQSIQHDVGTEERVDDNSAFYDTISTRETEQQVPPTNTPKSHSLLGIEPKTEEWLTTIEGLILDHKFVEAQEEVQLFVDQNDICGKFLGGGLQFQVCVANEDAVGAWNRFWHSLRLMLEILKVDSGKLQAPFVQRLITKWVDEFYELLVDEELFWECTLCLRAGMAINAIFPTVEGSVEGSSLCFHRLGVAGNSTSDDMNLGEAHKILYRALIFVQHRYNSTRIDDLLANQLFQLLLLQDNILFNSMKIFNPALCLIQAWEKFGGDYVASVQKLREWTGEISSISEKKIECHGSNVDEETFAAGEAREQEMEYGHGAELLWQRELEIKSSGFLGLYFYYKKDYFQAEESLFKSISVALEHHKELARDSLLDNVMDLFGKALFDTLSHLGKLEPYFSWFESQLHLIEALSFKYLLEHRFGQWLFEAGHRMSDRKVMDRSLELLWKSGRALVQDGDIDNIESGIFAYGDSIRVAMIMNEDNFDKPWEIVEEALGYSEIRDDEEKRLWEQLWEVAKNSCKPILNGNSVYKLQRAKRGLEKAREFALQVTVEEDSIFFQSHIEFSMASLLLDCTSFEIVAYRVYVEEAINLLVNVCKRLDERLDGEAFSNDASELLKEARNVLQHAYGLADKHQEAGETSLHSYPMSLTDNKRTVLSKSAEAMSLSSLKLHDTALKAMNVAILEVERIPELRDDWELQVLLLINRSSILHEAGQTEKSLEDKEVAKQLCESHDFAFGGSMEIFEGFMSLLSVYIDSEDFEAAWRLVEGIDATARNNFASGPTGEFVDKYAYWEHLKSKLMLMTVPKEKEASAFFKNTSTDFTAATGVFTPFCMDAMCSTEMPLATRHAIVDEGKLVIGRDGRLSEDVQTPMSCETRKILLRCYQYVIEEDGEQAAKELQKAIDDLELLLHGSRNTSISLDVVHMYALQAVVYVVFGNHTKAYTSIERARVQMERTQKECDPMYDRAKEYVKFHMNASAQSAADAGRNLISRFTNAQLQIPTVMEFGWVQTLEESSLFYRRMEWIAVEHNNELEGLLWAERGQMRLFMRIVESYKKSAGATGEESTRRQRAEAEGKFDRDDAYAVQVLLKTLKSCPKNVAIVKYSYSDLHDILVVYLLAEAGKKRSVRLISDVGREFRLLFNKSEGCDKKLEDCGKKLNRYVKELLFEIKAKKDSAAQQYLSTLHELLVEPILPDLPNACDTLLFSHQGLLSRVPFHALYDASKKKFLIQQKRVGYIPSVRALGYCFDRQDEYRERFSRGILGPPFLAGNPSPMGKGMVQLENAKKEAQAVAEILGNKSYAHVDEAVTKRAVKEALCSSCMTLLSTHCDDKALILQASGQQQQEGFARSACLLQTEVRSRDLVLLSLSIRTCLRSSNLKVANIGCVQK